jgi:ornithine cyclodeaminase
MKLPGAFTLDLPLARAEIEAKAAYLNENPYYVIKVRSNFRDNPKINLPAQHGLMIVFDAATGFPAAILLDNGYITAMSAGAVGALTVKHLANKNIERVAVLGSGRQAYMQIKYLMSIREISTVSVWGRTPLNVDSYARLIVEDHDLDVEIAPTPEAAVQEADLIITATASQTPNQQADWLKPGVHIIAVGSNHPDQQELYPNVLQRADIIIADDLEQCIANGEIGHALATGVIARADIRGELGDLLIGKVPGRTHLDQITVADLTGLDVQETGVATLALERATFLGLGQRTEVSPLYVPSVPLG